MSPPTVSVVPAGMVSDAFGVELSVSEAIEIAVGRAVPCNTIVGAEFVALPVFTTVSPYDPGLTMIAVTEAAAAAAASSAA